MLILSYKTNLSKRTRWTARFPTKKKVDAALQKEETLSESIARFVALFLV